MVLPGPLQELGPVADMFKAIFDLGSFMSILILSCEYCLLVADCSNFAKLHSAGYHRGNCIHYGRNDLFTTATGSTSGVMLFLRSGRVGRTCPSVLIASMPGVVVALFNFILCLEITVPSICLVWQSCSGYVEELRLRLYIRSETVHYGGPTQ